MWDAADGAAPLRQAQFKMAVGLLNLDAPIVDFDWRRNASMHVREHSWQRALIALEAFHVLFLLTHDWLPLPPFNDIAGVRSQNTTPRLIRDTLINTLPMAILLGISLRYADRPFPRWLKWLTAILYGVFFAGELQAWWIPYFFGTTPRAGGLHAPRPMRFCRSAMESCPIRCMSSFTARPSRRSWSRSGWLR